MPEVQRKESIRDAVSGLLKSLVEAGKRVVFVQSDPRPNINIPRLFARKLNNGEKFSKEYGSDRKYFECQTKLSYSIVQDAASVYPPDQVSVVYPEKVLCDKDFGNVIIDSEIMFSDDNHLSIYGAKKVAIPILEAVLKIVSK